MLRQGIKDIEIYVDAPADAPTDGSSAGNPLEKVRQNRAEEIAFRAPKRSDPKSLHAKAKRNLKLPMRVERSIKTSTEGRSMGAEGDALRMKRDGVGKEARRRTIYVPSEDTTIFTIHPGAYSGAFVDSTDTLCGVEISSEMSRDSASIALKTISVKSSPTASRRAALQPAFYSLQQRTFTQDRPGAGPGKENLNPGDDKITACSSFTSSIGSGKREEGSVMPQKQQARGSSTFSDSGYLSRRQPKRNPPSASSVGCGSPKQCSKNEIAGPKRVARFDYISKSCNSYSMGSKPTCETLQRRPLKRVAMEATAFPTAFPHVTPKNHYPLIKENISEAHMFADGWLNDMESVCMQLMNDIFGVVEQKRPCQFLTQDSLRRSLLQLYQAQPISLLYQKLKISLQHGALALPEGSVQRTSMVRTDIGLRKRFIRLWTESFDLSLLRAALEVVIGRQILACSSVESVKHLPSRQCGENQLKKHTERFIDSCLLQNDDAPLGENKCIERSNVQYAVLSWRRTTLRSLMLLHLLDRAKSLGLLPSKILFLVSSRFKSTDAILKEVSALILPSFGDITRPLAHLGYRVQHEQLALDEYQYRVGNLATDLRDGVRLTHLVEILGLPTNLCVNGGGTKQVSILGGYPLHEAAQNHEERNLSQQLRYPCPARSQKIYNVQIALCTLNNIDGVKAISRTLKAEDVVDGNREKTLALLWGLVGRWGLDLLVDFSDLIRETRRFKKARSQTLALSCCSIQADDEAPEKDEKRSYQLKRWARSIAQLHGLKLENFTTSFADGKIFHKIIDEYMPLIPLLRQSEHEPDNKESSLGRKLQALGCTACFGKALMSSLAATPLG